MLCSVTRRFNYISRRSIALQELAKADKFKHAAVMSVGQHHLVLQSVEMCLNTTERTYNSQIAAVTDTQTFECILSACMTNDIVCLMIHILSFSR